MEYSTTTPNERVGRITQLARFSFNHPSVVLTADVLQFFRKSTRPWNRPHEVAQVTQTFGGVTTATYSYVIPVVNLCLLEGETHRYGVTLQTRQKAWTHWSLLPW